MRIAVTGALGFIGTALVRALSARGFDVVAMARRAPPSPLAGYARWVVGDMVDGSARANLFGDPVEAVVHLAALPAGACERDPALSKRVNIDGTLALLDDIAQYAPGIRFVYASSVAVIGSDLPSEGVDDATPLRPSMIYGIHKAMIETAIAGLSRRGAVDGLSLRIPAVLARPRGAAGMKSAFLSDLFHARLASEAFEVPVSPQATLWMSSLDRCIDNLIHGVTLSAAALTAERALTLPALQAGVGDLVGLLAAATAQPDARVTFRPDPALEAAIGRQPPLSTPCADRLGFSRDTDLADLIRKVLAQLRTNATPATGHSGNA